MTSQSGSEPGGDGRDHRLTVERVELVGGGREVTLLPGLNVVLGAITTGKTTFVRLLRSLLGTVPDQLPPEVALVSAVRGDVRLGRRRWRVYRPITTTGSAPVEVASVEADSARDGETGDAIRLPATGRTASYSRFLLDRLGLPAVEVPRAAVKEPDALQPVTMTDWLGYCIVTGDELDLQVFGHRDTWRNRKRKWIFQLAYGFYDVQLAELTAELRRTELRLDALESEAEVIQKFLADTPFADRGLLGQALAEQEQVVATVRHQQAALAQSSPAADVGDVRQQVLRARETLDDSAQAVGRLELQIRDLEDLKAQLASQSARLTRAIVSDEWLVDFDFVVCPRCGSDIDVGRPRDEGHCYLCLQTEAPRTTREALLAEQSRLVSQIAETEELIAARSYELGERAQRRAAAEARLGTLAAQLDARTNAFVSDRAGEIRRHAAAEAAAHADILRLREYLALHERFAGQGLRRQELEATRDELIAAIESHQLALVGAEENVKALEQRLLSYLQALHIPQLGDLLTVTINRNNFLPEISGRTFDELSSQGLKTIVNVAHALAHHTVAIDRGLPLPGLLILDGLSANAGREGYDRERVVDVYELLISQAEEYKESLQVIAVDNDVPEAVRNLLSDEQLALELTQSDRLIRSAALSD